MNAQQRLLLIFMRLMSGKKVNKYELMEKFDKKESTVQRDIAKIESLLEDEVYGMVSKEKMRIERDGKGNYQLLKENGHLLNNELTDMEVLMVLKILVSTRIMTQTEMKNKFRINNMKNLRVLSSNHKTKYIDKFEAGILRNQTNLPFLGNPIKMVIDFYYDPVYVLNRFPNAKIIKVNEDDSFRIEMNVNDGYGTKMWLSSQSHMVKVISPKHMRDYLIQDMLETLKLYDIELL